MFRTSSFVNEDGDKVIKASIKGWDFAIIYDKDKKVFRFLAVEDSAVVEMRIGRQGSKDLECRFVYISDQMYCDGLADVYPDLYTKNSNLYFLFKEYDGLPSSKFQELGNIGFEVAMSGWEYLLIAKANMQMKDIGFIKY